MSADEPPIGKWEIPTSFDFPRLPISGPLYTGVREINLWNQMDYSKR
jgi:hypothetical protein